MRVGFGFRCRKMGRGLRCFTKIENIIGKKNRVIPEGRRFGGAFALSTGFLSTGEADTIERPGSDASTVLLSARLYESKGSPASFDGRSRVAGRILSAADSDRRLL